MKRWYILGLIAVACGISLGGRAETVQPVRPFTMGVYPQLSARAVIKAYQPVRHYLETALRRPVEIYTAPTFKSFAIATKNAEFDIVVTPPQLARLAQLQAGYIPILDYGSRHSCVIVVGKDNPISNFKKLRSKTIAIPDPISLVALVGMQWLGVQGMQAGRDFKLLTTPSHGAAVAAVQSGKSEAAIINAAALKRIAPELARSVRILTTYCDYPDALYLANPKLTTTEIQQIKASLLKFANETPAGKQFLETNNLVNLHLADPIDLERMDLYLQNLQIRMEKSL